MALSAVKAARAFVELFVDMSSLDKGLAKARARLQAFSRTAGSIGLGGIKIGAAITAPLAAAGAMAIKASGDFEATRISLEALIGDVGKAREILREADKYAAQTSFGLADVTSAIRSLKGYRVATEDVMRVTKMLGNISSATQIPLGELAEVYGRNSQQGSVLTKDIREFSSRGIPVLDELRKKFGDVWKAAEEGRITFGDIDAALMNLGGSSGSWGKMSEIISKTLMGQLSIAYDQLMLVARAIGDVMLPYVKMAVDMFIKYSGAVTEFIKANPAIVSSAVAIAAAVAAAGLALISAGSALAAFAAIASGIAVMLQPIVIKIALLTASVGMLAYAFRDTLASAIKWATSFIVAHFGWMSDAFNLSWEGIQRAFAAGDLQGAVTVAMTGFTSIMAEGLTHGLDLWFRFKAGALDALASFSAGVIRGLAETLKTALAIKSQITATVSGAMGAAIFGDKAPKVDPMAIAADLAASGAIAKINTAIQGVKDADSATLTAAKIGSDVIKDTLKQSAKRRVFDTTPEVAKVADAAKGGGGDPVASTGPAKSVFGTFSAFSIRAGVGSDVANRTANAAEKTAENTRRLLNKEAVFE